MRRHSDMVSEMLTVQCYGVKTCPLKSRYFQSSVSINPIQALHICNLAGPDVVHHRDGKFSSGMHVFCPYIHCNFKNSQFQTTGKFPAGKLLNFISNNMLNFFLPSINLNLLRATFSEFMLNHLHSNHKHRRYDGESLDMTMVVPQVEVCRPMTERRGAICNPSQPQQATLQVWSQDTYHVD